jgi:lipopolysaccharide export system permease protein
LVFYNGYRYEGRPGDLDFRILEFSEHQLPLSIKTDQDNKIDLSSEQLSSLLQKNSLEAMAEVQWRISPAIALIILVFLAIPLSKSSPRNSRYTGLILGILIYMIYANCLGAARVWFEQGVTPEIYGLWWVHVTALMLGIFMLLINYRVFQRMLSRRK